MGLKRVSSRTRKGSSYWTSEPGGEPSSITAILEKPLLPFSHLLPALLASFSRGLFWARTLRFTSLIPGAKIDGRGHVGKETIDESWSDNFLTGKRFGQNLHAASKKKNRHIVQKGKATVLKCLCYYIHFLLGCCLLNYISTKTSAQ